MYLGSTSLSVEKHQSENRVLHFHPAFFLKYRGSCRIILSARNYTTNCMNIISNPQYTD